jgi:2-methylcitrate dehydratase PrpD
MHDAARVHAFSIVLPAALAATELRGSVDGRALLTTVALGSEVFCRLGLTGFNTLARGWHPTTGYGYEIASASGSGFAAMPGSLTSKGGPPALPGWQ